MTTPTDLPDLAHRRPTLVAVPPQASRHMTVEDVTAQAMDRIMGAAQSVADPIADAARTAVEHLDRVGHWDVGDLDALAEAVRAGGAS